MFKLMIFTFIVSYPIIAQEIPFSPNLGNSMVKTDPLITNNNVYNVDSLLERRRKLPKTRASKPYKKKKTLWSKKPFRSQKSLLINKKANPKRSNDRNKKIHNAHSNRKITFKPRFRSPRAEKRSGTTYKNKPSRQTKSSLNTKKKTEIKKGVLNKDKPKKSSKILNVIKGANGKFPNKSTKKSMLNPNTSNVNGEGTTTSQSTIKPSRFSKFKNLFKKSKKNSLKNGNETNKQSKFSRFKNIFKSPQQNNTTNEEGNQDNPNFWNVNAKSENSLNTVNNGGDSTSQEASNVNKNSTILDIFKDITGQLITNNLPSTDGGSQLNTIQNMFNDQNTNEFKNDGSFDSSDTNSINNPQTDENDNFEDISIDQNFKLEDIEPLNDFQDADTDLPDQFESDQSDIIQEDAIENDQIAGSQNGDLASPTSDESSIGEMDNLSSAKYDQSSKNEFENLFDSDELFDNSGENNGDKTESIAAESNGDDLSTEDTWPNEFFSGT